MKHIKTGARRASFKVLASTRSAQFAQMVLGPGESTGESQNEHPQSEQWLFVVSGIGQARINKRRVPIRQNSLLLIVVDFGLRRSLIRPLFSTAC